MTERASVITTPDKYSARKLSGIIQERKLCISVYLHVLPSFLIFINMIVDFPTEIVKKGLSYTLNVPIYRTAVEVCCPCVHSRMNVGRFLGAKEGG